MSSRQLVPGVWTDLLSHAIRLIDDIHARGVSDPFWTFGGGTVLMLRYQHRRSKDIDIFVPDPQYLGFVTPRLSAVAEAVSGDYVETANHVKLIRPEGEIDFVASPNLTEPAFEIWSIKGHSVRVETAVEIIAKKMWHRGDSATGRDLFDLSLVIEKERPALASAAKFLLRHRSAFLTQIRERDRVLRAQFDQIDVMNYRATFDQCRERAESFLRSLPATPK